MNSVTGSLEMAAATSKWKKIENWDKMEN